MHHVFGWLKLLKYPAILVVASLVFWYVRNLPVDVVDHSVTRGTVVRSVMGTGTLEARIRTTVSPKISGRIAEVLVDQGATVSAGQCLARLDDDDLSQQVRMAEAVILSSEATLGRFQAEIQQAKTSFTKAEADLKRSQPLMENNSLSQAEFDQYQQAYDLARAGLLKAEANLLEAERQVNLNRETLKFQQARLADTQLLAPFDGLVIERQRDPGSIVVPGSPILQVVSLDELWISAWVDETELDRLAAGQPAKIVFRSLPDQTFDGIVARLGKQTDRETRELTVDVRAIQLPVTWAIGQRAEVYIETERVENDLWIPDVFLTTEGQQVGTYVVAGGQAEWRPLRLGIAGRDTVRVIDGLQVGDTVIRPSAAGDQLSSGVRVKLP